MAKFVGGPPPFIGTRDNLTIYLMKGEYIARTKSSLTGKRVKRDPAFARTMENAGRLKKASCIASHIYRQMPAGSRVYKQYRELVGKAMRLLKDGFNVDYVLTALEVGYLVEHLSDYLPQANRENDVLLAANHPHEKRAADRPEYIFLYKIFAKEYSSSRRNINHRRSKAPMYRSVILSEPVFLPLQNDYAYDRDPPASISATFKSLSATISSLNSSLVKPCPAGS